MNRTSLEEAFHGSRTLVVGGFIADASRWPHGGVYATPERRETPGDHVYRLPGPHRVLECEDAHQTTPQILRGWTDDEEFASVLSDAASRAGVGPLPLHRAFSDEEQAAYLASLREVCEEIGAEGWWIGGEVVLWNYDRLAHAELTP